MLLFWVNIIRLSIMDHIMFIVVVEVAIDSCMLVPGIRRDNDSSIFISVL